MTTIEKIGAKAGYVHELSVDDGAAGYWLPILSSYGERLLNMNLMLPIGVLVVHGAAVGTKLQLNRMCI